MTTPWTAQNSITCIRECKIRFQYNCKDVIYNTKTRACTPVYPKSSDNSTLDPVPGDILHSRIIDCESTAGFRTYENSAGNLTLCLLISTATVNRTNAESHCQEENGRLYVANTAEKISLVQDLVSKYTSNYTWVGLTEVGGSWVWENGEALDQHFNWGSGEPNGFPEETCVMVSKSELSFHDAPCDMVSYYICEKDF